MKVAITVWENRISPVFDASRMLMVAEVENMQVVDKKYVPFNPDMPSYLIENLNRMDIGILICGAVSEIPANLIEAGGIKLFPFITGYADDVLASYVQDAVIRSSFLMPGCGRLSGRSSGRHFRVKHPGAGKGHKRKSRQTRGLKKEKRSWNSANQPNRQEETPITGRNK